MSEKSYKPYDDKLYYKGRYLKVRRFNILAISTKIVYNKAISNETGGKIHGDHDPNGLMYVLKENEDILRKEVEENPFTPVDIIQPLVIRANLGDLLIIDFENKLDRPASIHIQGIQYNVLNSDGASIGLNPNTTTREKIRYKWVADKEGVFFFHDMSDPRSSEESTNGHGLFGALIVEPVGATWTDPVTGKEIKSGLYADIHHPSLPDFREYVTIFHDEPEIKDVNGNPPVSHETGMPESTMAINYRAEPMRNRHPHGTGGVGEEISMSSWPFGDPDTPVLRAYKGDPSKIRVINAGIKETHVFHLHNHQWRLEPNDPKSTIIDSISFSPQQSFTIEPLFGAGSLNGCIGDVIWHCHLYPHFMEGMWGLWRILDRLEDGRQVLPDGSCVPALIPLPDRTPPLPPDDEHPGYPRFITGEFGKKAFKPPLGIVDGREPTEIEQSNFVQDAKPGALYSNPCPADTVTKVFEVVAIQVPIKYNSQGWHDPEGRIFVLKENEEEIRDGKKEPEPFVIRANVGDCIEIRLTNKLPKTIGGNAFQLKSETTETGWHIHLVKFDTIASDGGANGWCNDSSADFGDTIIERFYADTELRTIFFHDHLFPNSHQQHGLFGALIIEPHNSTYHDSETGNEIKCGTKAIIKRPGEPDFREFVLAVHDFALLFDKDGKPLNPPPFPGSHDDPGVMGINYKNEPFQFRKGDPAYVFSSYMHGDPSTPLLESYEGDPIRIRLFDGAHEEQHSFNLHGLRWRKEPTDMASPLIQSQTLGISEAFNIEIDEDYKNGDYLYYFGGIDDLWLGLWGILRVHKEQVSHLLPLGDRPLPPKQTKPLPCKTGNPPPIAKCFDYPCTKNVNIRKFDIVAIQKDIIYNKFGDHDPNGLMFILAEHEKAIMDGTMIPKPLILRANAGDCIEITLTNHIFNPITQDEHPRVPVDTPFPPSNRVSIHAQLLKYDVLVSDGATVGFNYDQSIAPGESITYRWFADSELGACMLTGFGDIRNHRHHGLFGAIIIEPTGSKYVHPQTGEELKVGYQEQIVISNPGIPDFREFVVFMQDGISLYDKDDKPIPDPIDAGHDMARLDFEDQGQKGFNYRSERFENRLKEDPRVHLVMSSKIHGDPATPIFKSYPGDPIRIRLLMPADKPRNHSFVLHGHSWRAQYSDPFSDIISVQGAISVGNVFNVLLEGGANEKPGDYAYRSGIFRWDVELGMWGIFRIYDRIYKNLKVINDNNPFDEEKYES
ncbi:multicopper oxidase domain-containing protein [Desnuesiella massiliensis]|uniref:multicopper oxidase domain-containing protein n=1 Tax=Desnuesiella massiliensis TaxID=1650662 RepID=UPI0006E3CE3A|nr:multicopper oxidase domain-containing protein [Desnuesiella massiliensis]